MRRLILPAVALALAAVVVAFRSAPDETFTASAPEGAWTAVQVHAVLQDTTWTRDEERPNMLLFTDGHWASMRISGEGARAELAEDPTDEQRLEAWRRFQASGGSYSVSGSTISSKTLLVKNPNRTGDEWDSEFKMDGEKLVRVFSNSENGNSWTVTYKRMK